MRRFLRYAVEHGRKLRAVMMLDGVIAQKTVRVERFDEETVTLCIGARKTPITIPLGDLLSCDYARGDHGEE